MADAAYGKGLDKGVRFCGCRPLSINYSVGLTSVATWESTTMCVEVAAPPWGTNKVGGQAWSLTG
jgi:hypothetical protein